MKRFLVCGVVLLFLILVVARDGPCPETWIPYSQQDIVINRGSSMVDGIMLPLLINVNSQLQEQFGAAEIRGPTDVDAIMLPPLISGLTDYADINPSQGNDEKVLILGNVLPNSFLSIDNAELSVLAGDYSIPLLE